MLRSDRGGDAIEAATSVSGCQVKRAPLDSIGRRSHSPQAIAQSPLAGKAVWHPGYASIAGGDHR
jgi:hypothetical protein